MEMETSEGAEVINSDHDQDLFFSLFPAYQWVTHASPLRNHRYKFPSSQRLGISDSS